MKKEESLELNRHMFGDDFKWGVSTAAYQIEGAHDSGGKGVSIWDVFTNKKGSVSDNHNGNTACDFYNRYTDDIALLKQMGFRNFRFSLSWPRILPKGTGQVNQEGIDFYNNVINECLRQEIEPWVTLYHWDLPHELELQGGWTNRDIIDWFSDYTKICGHHFGDRVQHWMVMNEPLAFTGAGYFMGIHAPGRTGLNNFLPAVHHAVLAMAEGGRVLKEMHPTAQVGVTFSSSLVEPLTLSPKDIAAAKRVDVLLNRLFIEPILGMGYPEPELPVLKKLRKYFKPGDAEAMQFDFDFIGVQNYTREVVKYSVFVPYLNAQLVKAKNRRVPVTAMGWEVYPASIYQMLKKFNAYSNVKKIYITENGAAFHDSVEDRVVDDKERIRYFRDHLEQVLKARQEGVKVEGYFVWTLMDNFEWAEGYHPRFGLIYVDFETQERIVKASGFWYKEFLES